MLTPYDWQENITHRAEFVEARIASGVPVAAVSRPEGIVAASFKRRTRKLYEIYDRLMYAAIGQQSDVESLRVAAIDFAHREGFNRSEEDVTVQRVVSALSQPIKSSFGNFQTAPWVGKALFMEVGDEPALDRYYCLEYDGDYCIDANWTWLAGTKDAGDRMKKVIEEQALEAKTLEDAVAALRAAVVEAMGEAGDQRSEDERCSGLVFEAALMSREPSHERRFRTLAGDGLA
ncbi:MAG: hypothetical protein KIT11_06430 [Fimbriimonadaceae bacterium]|nr:hypothetical protein [Fimbriimonadaceae bacterium]QYK55993.1 MAG: hypothetical protein KF733_00620 [Fimbriimonadaceae bacterium]